MTRAEQHDDVPTTISRRTVVRSGAVVGAATVAGAVSGIRPASAHGKGATTTGRDLVLTNGRIHTMNGRHDVVRVLAIRAGRVAYAGNSLRSALRALPDRPRVLDLRGRTAIPGIIDNHNHLVLMGNRPGRHTPLENAYSIADVQRTYRARARGVRDAMAYAASVGVTTHLDQGAFQATGTPADGAAHEDNYTMHLPFLSLYEEDRAPVRLRINFLHMDTDPALPTLTDRLQNAFPFFGNDMVRTGGIGEFIAAGLGPTWLEAARRIARAGWRAEVHSLSQTDFRTEIEGFEAVNAETPITDLRWVVAHVPFITRDYVDRLKALGGGLSLTGWRYLTGTATAAGPPFRMIVDSGIHAGMSSDGMQIAPMNPFVHAYYATTGRNALGAVVNDGQQISRAELLDLYTRDNAWFLGRPDDDQLGTLEVGRLGDVAVLDRDYFTVPDDQLRQVSSVLTVVDGAIVHSSTGKVDR